VRPLWPVPVYVPAPARTTRRLAVFAAGVRRATLPLGHCGLAETGLWVGRGGGVNAGAAVQSQSMHIESVGGRHGEDREGRVSAQGATWEETKLKHQQTMQMQQLKDREHAAESKKKERAQAAHDKQLVRLSPPHALAGSFIAELIHQSVLHTAVRSFERTRIRKPARATTWNTTDRHHGSQQCARGGRARERGLLRGVFIERYTTSGAYVVSELFLTRAQCSNTMAMLLTSEVEYSESEFPRRKRTTHTHGGGCGERDVFAEGAKGEAAARQAAARAVGAHGGGAADVHGGWRHAAQRGRHGGASPAPERLPLGDPVVRVVRRARARAAHRADELPGPLRGRAVGSLGGSRAT